MSVLARSNHTQLSCYVDDVVLSGVEDETVESSRLALIEAAQLSNFVINGIKSQLPGPEITAFNVVLSNGELAITDDRMHEFESDLFRATPSAAAAIVAYVCGVNRSQADRLVQVVLSSSIDNVQQA